jgi:hypothetical protein
MILVIVIESEEEGYFVQKWEGLWLDFHQLFNQGYTWAVAD